MGNLYVPFLADAARLTGYPVVEVPGWRTLGHGGIRAMETVTGHHTANPQTGDYPSLNIVRNGRGDLAGPLAQLGLGRSGTVYVIAAGLCYQAGASRWAGYIDLNDEGVGIEAESAGTHDDWTAAQRDCYPRLIASLLYYMRRAADRFGFHKEVCVPKGRKIDAAYWDGPQTRERVAWLLADPLHRIPRFTTPVDDPDSGPASKLLIKKRTDPMAPIPLVVSGNRTFRATVMAETDTKVAKLSTLTFGSTWGDTEFTLTPLADGKVVGQQQKRTVKNNNSDWYDVPAGARLVTIEGTCSADATIPSAAIWIT